VVQLVAIGGDLITTAITNDSLSRLDLHASDPVWAVFNSFSVVLHID
jgi:molybdopterin-binding protein